MPTPFTSLKAPDTLVAVGRLDVQVVLRYSQGLRHSPLKVFFQCSQDVGISEVFR